MKRWTQLCIGLGLLFATVLSVVCFTRRAMPPTVGVDSPAVATTLVMLGGSRGILAEVLWWRISELQSQRRYAELVPLTDLLVTLEPTSEEAWAYNAHNLAYNISVAHEAPAERWEWVKRGIALLDRALRIQPTSQKLLTEMGGFWEDKIGSNRDRAAAYYRAHTMDIPPPPDAETFEARVGLPIDWANPHHRALYWYDRSGDAYRCLRVTLGVVGQATDAGPLPYYVQTVRNAWPHLSDRDRPFVLEYTRQLFVRYPHSTELKHLLQELGHDSYHW